jgi:hypothetical protein
MANIFFPSEVVAEEEAKTKKDDPFAPKKIDPQYDEVIGKEYKVNLPPKKEEEEDKDKDEDKDTDPKKVKVPDIPEFYEIKDELAERLPAHKKLREEDRKFFKDGYDKLVAEREKGMETLEWRKLAGVFMDAMAKYAAASYGAKHGVDMSDAKVTGSFDMEAEREKVDKRMEIALAKLKKTTDMRRKDTSEQIQEERDQIGRARREAIAERTFRVQAGMWERRAAQEHNREVKTAMLQKAQNLKKQSERAAKNKLNMAKILENNAKQDLKEARNMLDATMKQKNLDAEDKITKMVEHFKLPPEHEEHVIKEIGDRGWFFDSNEGDAERVYLYLQDYANQQARHRRDQILRGLGTEQDDEEYKEYQALLNKKRGGK